MAGTWRNLELDVIVDTAGGDRNLVERCLTRVRSTLPLGLSLRAEDLSRCAIAALDLRGSHFAIIDPNVDLSPNAFDNIGAILSANPGIDLLYGQESYGPDRLSRAIPGWSPERLRNHDYLPGLVVVSQRVAGALGSPSAPAPLHRWDLILRASEAALRIDHVVATLTHRREFSQQTATTLDIRAGLRVLQSHCNRIGLHALATVGAQPGTYRAKRVMTRVPDVALILPGPHAPQQHQTPDATSADHGALTIVVCDPTEIVPAPAGHTQLVMLPEPTVDLTERIRWALSTCDTEFVVCLPPCTQFDNPMWLIHLASLISYDTVAAGPVWTTGESRHSTGTGVDGLEAEVEALPLAGTVVSRHQALAALDRSAPRPVDWFSPFLHARTFGGNLVLSGDIHLAAPPQEPGEAAEHPPGADSRFRRRRRRLFPLSA